MKAHWADIFNSFAPHSTIRTGLSNKVDKRVSAYEVAIGRTPLVLYNYKVSIRLNLDMLEVGQGFFLEEGVNFSAKGKLPPKKFRTYMNKLIVRVR